MQKNQLKYIEPSAYIDSPVPERACGECYGSKIPTSKLAVIDGKSYRVYATCYGNGASIWVKIGKQRFYIHS